MQDMLLMNQEKNRRNMLNNEEIAIAATARHVADESRKESEKYVE